MKLSELHDDKNLIIHAIFVGDPGTWKTVCAGSFPKPLFFDFDRGSVVLLGTPWAEEIEVEQPTTFAEVDKIINYIKAGKNTSSFSWDPNEIGTIVFDSALTMNNMLLQHYCEVNMHWDADAGLPSKQCGVLEYGQRIRWYEFFVNSLKRYNINCIFICHEELIRQNEDFVEIGKKNDIATGKLMYRPSLPGKQLPGNIGGYLDEVYRFAKVPGATSKIKILMEGSPIIQAKSRLRGLLGHAGSIELLWGESFYEKLMSGGKGKKK